MFQVVLYYMLYCMCIVIYFLVYIVLKVVRLLQLHLLLQLVACMCCGLQDHSNWASHKCRHAINISARMSIEELLQSLSIPDQDTIP